VLGIVEEPAFDIVDGFSPTQLLEVGLEFGFRVLESSVMGF
jgi:hypothetical protein